MSFTSPFSDDAIQPTNVSYAEYALTSDLQLEWPFIALTYPAARVMKVSAVSVGLSLLMPSAQQVSVGQDALIINVGAQTITIKSLDGGTTIASLSPGTAKYIVLSDNNDDDGEWTVFTFGTGTSSADASALAGYGLVALGATLSTQNASYAISDGESITSALRASGIVWEGGSGSATLDAAADLTDGWFALFKNNGTGTFTLNTSGGDQIDTASSKSFNPSESAIILCTGTEFVTIGFGVSTQFQFTYLTKAVTGGTVTLTPVEASNTIQAFSGTLASNATIVYPPVVNLYVISNQCDNAGHTFTISTDTGGTDLSIPAGYQVTVFCDGQNFFNANTVQVGSQSISLPNGAVGAPSLSFASEANSGMYRPAAGRIGFAIIGTEILDIRSTGTVVTGTGTFSGGISGGTF